ncbi:TPA: hypothetical protein ACQQJB_003630 [Pseudomonas aeruginosa]
MTKNTAAGQPGTSNTSLQQRQRHYDRLHHQKRLQNLDGEWGASMPKHDALTLRNGSEAALQQINEHGMSCNSVDLNDSAYLAELDAFATQAA